MAGLKEETSFFVEYKEKLLGEIEKREQGAYKVNEEMSAM